MGSQANTKGYRPHFTSNIKDTGNYHMQLRGSDTGVGYLFYLTLQSPPNEMLGEGRKNLKTTLANYDAPRVHRALIVCQDVSSVPVSMWHHVLQQKKKNKQKKKERSLPGSDPIALAQTPAHLFLSMSPSAM